METSEKHCDLLVALSLDYGWLNQSELHIATNEADPLDPSVRPHLKGETDILERKTHI